MCNIGNRKHVIEIPKEKAIVAYRIWETGLNSLYQPNPRTKWGMKKIVRSHAKPTMGNHAGLYCFKSPSARYWALEYSAINPYAYRIVGTIKIWGTIVEHEKGYRASHAEITRITKGKEYM